MKHNNKIIYGAAFLAGLICFVVFLKALSCGFVNYDDQDYVINNTGIRSLGRDFWGWAFATIPINFWVPLLWVSFALDYHFWGLNPFGYHLTNNILHAVNTGLVVIIAHEFYKSGELTEVGKLPGHRFLYIGMLVLAGVLFGIHPARVESVVWVTERKDVLNGIFTLSSIFCYVRYQLAKEKLQAAKNSYSLYVLSLFLFLCSLLSKPSSLILPATLLVIDLYPLRRFTAEKVTTIILEKIPYIAISVAVIMVSTFLSFNFNTLDEFPFSLRVIAAGNSLFQYFKIMIWPVNILPYYDLPRLIPKMYIANTLFITVVAGLAIVFVKKTPRLSAIIIFFIITILPTLHFFAGGQQIILGPRYTYLPSVLPSIIVAEIVASAISKFARGQFRYARFVIMGLVSFILIFYAVTTRHDIGLWKNSETMWSKVIEHQPFSKAYLYRAWYYFDSGNYIKAIEDYSTCISEMIKGQNTEVYNVYAFRGEALIKTGRFAEAVHDFTFAIAAFPHKLYYYQRGTAFEGLGRMSEAKEDFKRAGNAKGQMRWFSAGTPTQ